MNQQASKRIGNLAYIKDIIQKVGRKNIDFAEFANSMTLDEATDIALGALTLSTSGTGALDYNSTGQVSFAGNVDAENGLDVTTANLTVGGANFSVAQASGNITTAGVGFCR